LQENDVQSLDRLMTTEEAAKVLNVSYSWLKKAAQRGVCQRRSKFDPFPPVEN
jgi:hypothetical protein